MISFDTNILITALEKRLPGHEAARAFLDSMIHNDGVAVCELVLLELYTLLRNPKVCASPLDGPSAVAVVHAFRSHPAWCVLDYDKDIAGTVWEKAKMLPARLQIYDTRLALTLRHHGVTEFATRNVKDFQGFGFKRVWDPCV
jgi:uncharacterized protein